MFSESAENLKSAWLTVRIADRFRPRRMNERSRLRDRNMTSNYPAGRAAHKTTTTAQHATLSLLSGELLSPRQTDTGSAVRRRGDERHDDALPRASISRNTTVGS